MSTVQQAIAFCRGLRNNKDDKFSIFPLLVEDDSGQSTGFNYKILNAFGKDETVEKIIAQIPGFTLELAKVNVFNPDMTTPDSDFYNATKRIEYVENVSISLNEALLYHAIHSCQLSSSASVCLFRLQVVAKLLY